MQTGHLTHRVLRTMLLIGVAMLGVGCAASASTRGYVAEVNFNAANYTEDYIHEYYLETPDGGELGGYGAQVKPFSNGGTSTGTCCSPLPGVGQSVKVIWKTGGYNDPRPTWTKHAVVVKIIGKVSDEPDSYTALYLRFFPNDQVEAEYISESLKSCAPLNPRVDLIFSGQRVMRHFGE